MVASVRSEARKGRGKSPTDGKVVIPALGAPAYGRGSTPRAPETLLVLINEERESRSKRRK